MDFFFSWLNCCPPNSNNSESSQIQWTSSILLFNVMPVAVGNTTKQITKMFVCSAQLIRRRKYTGDFFLYTNTRRLSWYSPYRMPWRTINRINGHKLTARSRQCPTVTNNSHGSKASKSVWSSRVCWWLTVELKRLSRCWQSPLQTGPYL